MKIKHWQGYGTVNAEKVSMKKGMGVTTLIIRVTGNHEWGLLREDEYDLINWLVKRFDKSFKGNRLLDYTYDHGYRRVGSIDEEYCTYIMSYESE